MKGLSLKLYGVRFHEVPESVHLARTIPGLTKKFHRPMTWKQPGKKFFMSKKKVGAILKKTRARGQLGYARACKYLPPDSVYCFVGNLESQAKIEWVNENPLSGYILRNVENHAIAHLLLKFKCSFVYYGSSGDTKDWNMMVRVLDACGRLDFGLPDFSICLDHTPGVDDSGYSKYSDTYLDSIFGLIVHYKGEHVMTIGFSVARGNRVLVHQIQLKKHKGNKFLYKLPVPYHDHVLSVLGNAFRGFDIYLIDGDMLGKKILGMHKMWVSQARDAFRAMSKIAHTDDPQILRALRESLEEYRAQKTVLIEMKSKVLARMREFYGNSFRSHLLDKNDVFIGNKLTFYRVLARDESECHQ